MTKLDPRLTARLQDHFGNRFSMAQAVCEQHGRDESAYPVTPPDGVVFADSTLDVQFLVQQCNQFKVPVIAFGAGSSLEGHVLAFEGGISLDLTRMNQILSVNQDDLMATAQAGVTRNQLNNEIRHTGLFFPIDPGADATLGGMSATRASGTNAVRYGTMRENVVNLTVVTAQGEIIKTAQRAKKSSAGYDLTRIFVGSEGTLGIITEVTVRLYPQPEAIAAAVCSFSRVEDAVNTVIQTIQMGVPIARAEMLDGLTIKAINLHSKTSLREQPMLFLEFHGSPQSVKEQSDTVQMLAKDLGGQDFEWAHQTEDRNRLWMARHHAYFACLQLRPGCRAVTTDVCVPLSSLSRCIQETLEDFSQSSLQAPVFGHVGDGNFHCLILVDPNSQSEMDEAERLNHRLVERALAEEGTCTGEHGIGRHKIDLLRDELGEPALDLMRSLKRAWDPLGILNPGKVLA
jgi:D-lactate dehydrogenase (cytochrome)